MAGNTGNSEGPNIIKVRLKLFASLRKYQTSSTEPLLEVQNGTTVGQLLKLKGVPLEEAPIILINGIAATEAQILNDGDNLSVFPLIGGG